MKNTSSSRFPGTLTSRGLQDLVLKVLALAAILALSFVVSGCGSSSSTGSGEESPDSTQEKATQEAREKKDSPLEAVQVAYKTTASRETARISSTIDISGMPMVDAQPAEMSLSSRGVIDFIDGSYSLTMRMPYLGRVESRQVGDKLYQKYPRDVREQMPGQEPWLEIDLDALEQNGVEVPNSETQNSDPTQQLAYLKGVSDSVEKVGKEEIRGVSTTHYKAAVDPGKDLEQYNPETRKAYEELAKELDGEKLPTEVWLDSEGQVRRYEMSMTLILPEDLSSPNGAVEKEPGGRIEIVQELYDFGTPVDVEPPPQSQTSDATDMMTEQTSGQV